MSGPGYSSTCLAWLTPTLPIQHNTDEEVTKIRWFSRGTQRDDSLLNTLKTLFRPSRVVLDLYKYILRGVVKICIGHPKGTRVFSKLQGLQYYFPEDFGCILTFYESENYSDSSLRLKTRRVFRLLTSDFGLFITFFSINYSHIKRFNYRLLAVRPFS